MGPEKVATYAEQIAAEVYGLLSFEDRQAIMFGEFPLVVTADGLLQYHEVKGFWRDDARVKIKVAARLFRDRKFIAVQWKAKRWVFEVISPSGV